MGKKTVQSEATQESSETERRRRDPQRDAQISAETTERWFFPQERERLEHAYERRCQDRSLREFS